MLHLDGGWLARVEHVRNGGLRRYKANRKILLTSDRSYEDPDADLIVVDDRHVAAYWRGEFWRVSRVDNVNQNDDGAWPVIGHAYWCGTLIRQLRQQHRLRWVELKWHPSERFDWTKHQLGQPGQRNL